MRAPENCGRNCFGVRIRKTSQDVPDESDARGCRNLAEMQP
jgi:hypothetical protein